MAGAPIRRRDARSLTQDMQTLTRLRTAVQIDTTRSMGERTECIEKIDALLEHLAKWLPSERPSQTLKTG
jgi:hypothetical protein